MVARSRRASTPVLVVRVDGSVGWRYAEPTTTRGLVVVADCKACDGTGDARRHVHRRWRIQTTSGFLVGDLSLPSRADAQAAARALGELAIDWRNPAITLDIDPESRAAALAVVARWGLAHAAA